MVGWSTAEGSNRITGEGPHEEIILKEIRSGDLEWKGTVPGTWEFRLEWIDLGSPMMSCIFCFGFCDFCCFSHSPPGTGTMYRAGSVSPLTIWVQKCTYNACLRDICVLLNRSCDFDSLWLLNMPKPWRKCEILSIYQLLTHYFFLRIRISKIIIFWFSSFHHLGSPRFFIIHHFII